MKWACYEFQDVWESESFRVERRRFEALSEFLSQKGQNHQFELLPAAEGLKTSLPPQWDASVLSDYEHVRFTGAFSRWIPGASSQFDLSEALLRVGDGMIYFENRWWVRSALREAICRQISSWDKLLDLTADVFIVGTGASARASISALFKAGFRRFRVTGRSQESYQKMVDDMVKHHFDIFFEFVPREKIVLMTGQHSIVVNASPLGENNELLNELSYLNFLKRDGVVWDLALSSHATPLLQEAEDVGLMTVDGRTTAGWVDVIWLEWAFGYKGQPEEYVNFLRQALSD